MAEIKKYTYEEVAKHKKEGDVWMIIKKKVYNVTNFVEQHPGGGEVLLDVGGRDATQDFEDVGHSEEAHKLMAEYYIGDLDAPHLLNQFELLFANISKKGSAASEKKVEQVATPQRAPEVKPIPPSGGSSLTYIIPIAVLAVSILAYFIVSRN